MALAGKRVLITRAPEDSGPLRAALESRGAQVISLPTIRRAPPPDPSVLPAAAARIVHADAVAVGALSALRPLVPFLKTAVRAVVGCVGERTAAGLDEDPVLSARFVGPRLVPSPFRAEALAETLVDHFGGLTGRRIFVPRAPQGREILPQRLRAAGADVDEVLTYVVAPAKPPAPQLWAAARAADVALFLSGETLANLLRVVPAEQARALLAEVVVGVIGPVAAERAAELGIRVDVMPDQATQAALIDAVDQHAP